jgi:hypothetical protein
MTQSIANDNRVKQYLDRQITAAVSEALTYGYRVEEHQKKLAETLNRLGILRQARKALLAK